MTRHHIRGLVIFVFLISFVGGSAAAIGQQDGVYTVHKKKPGQELQPKEQQEDSRRQSSVTTPPPNLPSSEVERHQTAQEPKEHQEDSRQQSAGETPQQNLPSPQIEHEQSTKGASHSNITERVLSRKLGSERFQQLLGQIENMKTEAAGKGRGAPNSDVWFDGARPRSGNDDELLPSGTQFFSGGGSQSQVREPVPSTSAAIRNTTVQESRQTTGEYGGIPGGIVLEGTAIGLAEINSVRYDSRFNAFILNDNAVYLMKVPSKTVAVLCRAIAEDEMERVGVSLGKVQQVYGKVPKHSELALDMKIADHFLGDIVFAENDWTEGYRFADDFRPEPNQGESFSVAVFFTFNGFQFQVRQEEVQLTHSNLDVRFFPLSQSVTSEGGLLPDEDAIAKGRVCEQYELNARHIAEHISYYRRERIIDRIFSYGEVAAFIRELKRAGFDLEDLADHIPGGKSF
jgi:hypothetical protein